MTTRPGVRVAATALASVLALALMSCAGPDAGPAARDAETGVRAGSATSDSSPSSPSPTSAEPSEPTTPPALPPVPPLRRPAQLARHLDHVATTLRDPEARRADVRAAGEYQQLAVRGLAGMTRVRRAVLDRVAPRTARTLRNDLLAASSLTSLTDPQPRLPDWRIVMPPPPRELVRLYRAAQRRTGAPWQHLAAIHLVETRMGRIRGTSTAGAQGPMQFIPATWDRYGAGGDVHDYRDAILAAGRLLRDHGAPHDMRDALWHYNPSVSYVRSVSAYARNMAREPRLYRGYWHWRVLYRHERGAYVLPEGYPRTRAYLLED